MDFKKLKIVDLSSVLAGPLVGSFFAELGAEVLKIEHPIHKDVTRSWKLAIEDPSNKTSAYFSSVNYKKRYLTLDLTNEQDYMSFISHIKNADVLLSNFKKGDDVKLNITDETLRKINPNLIIGKISGFGLSSDRVAYDLIVQAEAGFMSINGEKDSSPLKMPVALIDVLAAHQLKEGLLVAIINRLSGKKAVTISVSLYDTAVCSLVNQASNFLMTGEKPVRRGNLHPNIAPYGEIFKTKDHKEITFAIGSNNHFESLCDFLKVDLDSIDTRFIDNQSRVSNRIQLAEIIQQKVSQLSIKSILKELRLRKVPCGEIRELHQVLQDNRAQELIRNETIEGENTSRITSIAFKWN